MNQRLVRWGLALLMAVTLGHTPAAAAAAPKPVLVETEAFADLGGWSLDQQFLDQMGSPYLLAHGLGTPVKDARTTVTLAQAGPYRVWVRTKDWVAQWNAPGTPGRFQLLLGGRAVPVTFGTEGAQWHWQDGGTVNLKAGTLRLALHDLTGFEGRCDAILLSADPAFTPPNDLPGLETLRHDALGLDATPADAGAYDLVVVGGGIAGTCAALVAARQGLSVALVQDRPVLGGNNSSEVRVWLNGETKKEPYPHIGDVVAELEPQKRAETGPNNTAEIYEDARRLALVRGEKNITLFMEYHVTGVTASAGAAAANKRIQSVTAQNVRTGRRIRLAGKLFADCTGDGEVGCLAGAQFAETKTQHMGPSNLWNVVDTGKPAPFPRCPWALDLSDKPFPGRAKSAGQWSAAGLANLGKWFWEDGFDWDPITDVEKMRDWNLRAMYGAWDALKNVDHAYPTHAITWAAFITGKRESRRLLGDVILTVEDLTTNKKFDDACFPCTWSIDLHVPQKEYVKGFEGQEFIAHSNSDKYPTPVWAPYRALYSRNMDNLFMAGRDISVTHEALGAVRVMRTCGMMGEVVGMAASICVKCSVSPRGVYTTYLDELKGMMAQGAGRPVPPRPAAPPPPIKATFSVSGVYPQLTVYNTPTTGECGIGAVVPWAGKLWIITYSPHMPTGSADKLYAIAPDMTMEVRPESIGGTPAGRMIHRESNQLFIGHYAIDAAGTVRVIDIKKMPMRVGAIARHPLDPAGKVIYCDMEGPVWEVDVHTLEAKKLFDKPVPGWHGKGAYAGQGRLIIANNGEMGVAGHSYNTLLAGAAPKNPDEMGVLAEWDGKTWNVVERKQFTEVTGPGGLSGNPDDKSPVWSIGWDRRSVILKLLDGGKWSTFRLPKAAQTYDHRGGWYTEWPRIREVTGGKWLMDMHGMFYDFPKTFSAANTAGITPLASHLRYIPDFCAWNGRLVLATDETTILENPMAGQAQSNLWFGKLEDLKEWGPRAGSGGPWVNDPVKAGVPSDPFLINGFDQKVVHLANDGGAGVNFTIESDARGNGQWEKYKTIEVPAHGYRFHIFPPEFKAQWVRVTADRDVTTATVFFHFSDPTHAPAGGKAMFASLAGISTGKDAGQAPNGGLLRPSNANKNLIYVAQQAASGGTVKDTYYEIDEKLGFTRPTPDKSEIVKKLNKVTRELNVSDGAAVTVTWKGRQYRLPYQPTIGGQAQNAPYDGSSLTGYPRSFRELESERTMLNAYGTLYLMGREGGAPTLQPVCTHNKQIMDLCTWRGLLAIAGTRQGARPDGHFFGNTDTGLWFGQIDDLWKMGKPVGVGAIASRLKAGVPSDPFLMTGYDRKKVELHNLSRQPVTLTLEVDVDHSGAWHAYQSFAVPPGERHIHFFPAGYSAHWIRVKADQDCSARVTFTYE